MSRAQRSGRRDGRGKRAVLAAAQEYLAVNVRPSSETRWRASRAAGSPAKIDDSSVAERRGWSAPNAAAHLPPNRPAHRPANGAARHIPNLRRVLAAISTPRLCDDVRNGEIRLRHFW